MAMKKTARLPQARRAEEIAARRRMLIVRWRGELSGAVKYYRWDREHQRLVQHRCGECGR